MKTPPTTPPVQALIDVSDNFGVCAVGVRPVRTPEYGIVWLWYVKWTDGDPDNTAIIYDKSYERGALKIAAMVLERAVCLCGRPIGFDQESGMCFWSYKPGAWKASCEMDFIDTDADDRPVNTQFEELGDELFPDAMEFVRDRLDRPFRWRPMMN